MLPYKVISFFTRFSLASVMLVLLLPMTTHHAFASSVSSGDGWQLLSIQHSYLIPDGSGIGGSGVQMVVIPYNGDSAAVNLESIDGNPLTDIAVNLTEAAGPQQKGNTAVVFTFSFANGSQQELALVAKAALSSSPADGKPYLVPSAPTNWDFRPPFNARTLDVIHWYTSGSAGYIWTAAGNPIDYLP